MSAAPTVPATPSSAPTPFLSTPDITAAQIAALATAVVGLAVAFGVPLSHDQQLAIEAFVLTFAPALVLVDALIRHSRAKYVHAALADLATAAAAVQPAATALVQANDGAALTAAGAAPLPPYIK